MFTRTKQKRLNGFFQGLVMLVLVAFSTTSLIPVQRVYAAGLNLPMPGTMVKMTSQFLPPLVKGIKIDPQNPLLFEFLMDPGQIPLDGAQKTIEYRKLIKYFLASLTTPEKDMWVNLSPYEHNRIISRNFGNTEMGRDMLAQDYILKQLAASLVYPEEDLGKKFWNKIYERVRKETGSADIPVNTFNKVWILPDQATVFEKGNVAMVINSRLKVMMEEDYLSLSKHNSTSVIASEAKQSNKIATNTLASQTIREIVIPAIEKEINEGQNFAQLRQMYQSMILASWFKQRLKMHLLSKVYVNKDKAKGVELQDPQDNERVYQRYLKAFKKGVYNYIKEEPDPISGQKIPRKYFSGGADYASLALPINSNKAAITTTDNAQTVANEAAEPTDTVIVQLERASNNIMLANGSEIGADQVEQALAGSNNDLDGYVSNVAQESSNALAQLLISLATKYEDKIFLIASKVKSLVRKNGGLGTWNNSDINKETQLIEALIQFFSKVAGQRQALGEIKLVNQSVAQSVLGALRYGTTDISKVASEDFAKKIAQALNPEQTDLARGSILGRITNGIVKISTIQRNDEEVLREMYEEALADWMKDSNIQDLLGEGRAEILQAIIGQLQDQFRQGGLSIPEARQMAQTIADNIGLLVEMLDSLSETMGLANSELGRDDLTDSQRDQMIVLRDTEAPKLVALVFTSDLSKQEERFRVTKALAGIQFKVRLAKGEYGDQQGDYNHAEKKVLPALEKVIKKEKERSAPISVDEREGIVTDLLGAIKEAEADIENLRRVLDNKYKTTPVDLDKIDEEIARIRQDIETAMTKRDQSKERLPKELAEFEQDIEIAIESRQGIVKSALEAFKLASQEVARHEANKESEAYKNAMENLLIRQELLQIHRALLEIAQKQSELLIAIMSKDQENTQKAIDDLQQARDRFQRGEFTSQVSQPETPVGVTSAAPLLKPPDTFRLQLAQQALNTLETKLAELQAENRRLSDEGREFNHQATIEVIRQRDEAKNNLELLQASFATAQQPITQSLVIREITPILPLDGAIGVLWGRVDRAWKNLDQFIAEATFNSRNLSPEQLRAQRRTLEATLRETLGQFDLRMQLALPIVQEDLTKSNKDVEDLTRQIRELDALQRTTPPGPNLDVIYDRNDQVRKDTIQARRNLETAMDNQRRLDRLRQEREKLKDRKFTVQEVQEDEANRREFLRNLPAIDGAVIPGFGVKDQSSPLTPSPVSGAPQLRVRVQPVAVPANEIPAVPDSRGRRSVLGPLAAAAVILAALLLPSAESEGEKDRSIRMKAASAEMPVAAPTVQTPAPTVAPSVAPVQVEPVKPTSATPAPLLASLGKTPGVLPKIDSSKQPPASNNTIAMAQQVTMDLVSFLNDEQNVDAKGNIFVSKVPEFMKLINQFPTKKDISDFKNKENKPETAAVRIWVYFHNLKLKLEEQMKIEGISSISLAEMQEYIALMNWLEKVKTKNAGEAAPDPVEIAEIVSSPRLTSPPVTAPAIPSPSIANPTPPVAVLTPTPPPVVTPAVLPLPTLSTETAVPPSVSTPEPVKPPVAQPIVEEKLSINAYNVLAFAEINGNAKKVKPNVPSARWDNNGKVMINREFVKAFIVEAEKVRGKQGGKMFIQRRDALLRLSEALSTLTIREGGFQTFIVNEKLFNDVANSFMAKSVFTLSSKVSNVPVSTSEKATHYHSFEEGTYVSSRLGWELDSGKGDHRQALLNGMSIATTGSEQPGDMYMFYVRSQGFSYSMPKVISDAKPSNSNPGVKYDLHVSGQSEGLSLAPSGRVSIGKGSLLFSPGQIKDVFTQALPPSVVMPFDGVVGNAFRGWLPIVSKDDEGRIQVFAMRGVELDEGLTPGMILSKGYPLGTGKNVKASLWINGEQQRIFDVTVASASMGDGVKVVKNDQAMNTELNKGGIDFDAKYLQMNLQGDGINIPIPAGFEWLLNTPIRGFTPQILDIRSGMGFELSFFKGLLTPEQERTAKANSLMRLASLCDHKFVMKEYFRTA